MTTKRRIFKLAPRITLFLLLGAVINVAVAWGLGFRDAQTCKLLYSEMTLVRGRGDNSLSMVSDHESFLLYSGFGRRGLPRLPKWSQLYSLPEDPERVCMEYAAGWPCVAVQYLATVKTPTKAFDPKKNEYESVGLPGLRTSDWLMQKRAGILLPIQPLWPGFAMNTIFYAVILSAAWLLFAFPIALRRRRRIKRGLCPACAYPVGTNSVCTECGKQVKP